MGRTAAGLDIGGTKVLGLVIDVESGAVLAEHRVRTPVGADAVMDALTGLVDELQGRTDRRIEAVGVGAAGLVDAKGVLRVSPNLPGVIDLDVAGGLRRHSGLPVAVDNDATAATVAEHRLGAARGVTDAVYVALGTGIGGGSILDGAIRRGANGFGGEFGHMVIDPSGPLCGCGQVGCWEQRASGSALGDLARSAVADGRAPSLAAMVPAGSAVTGEHVVTAAAADDAAGLAVMDEFSRWVALGLAALVNALDPAVIVIGGGVVEAGDVLMVPVRRHLTSLLMGAEHRPVVPVEPAHFGEDAGAVGAALLAADAV